MTLPLEWERIAREKGLLIERRDRPQPAPVPYQAQMKRPKRAPDGPSEAEFTQQVIDLADVYGFLVVHFRPAMVRDGTWVTAMSGDKGFPDIVMSREIGPPRLIFAELKVGKGKPTAEQVRWLDAIRRANVEAYLWTPASWTEIERTLKP